MLWGTTGSNRSKLCGAAGKVAGTRWQGTKTLIEDDVAEAGPQSVDAAEGRAGEPLCLPNAKWKKLAKAALLEVG